MIFVNVKKEKVFITLLLFLFLSCVLPPFEQQRDIPTFDILWHPIDDGLSFFTHTIEYLPLQFHVVKIDLTKISPFSAIESVSQPNENFLASQNSEDKIYFDGETTRYFAKKNNCIVAVNMNPFDYPFSRFSNVRQINGLYMLEGKQLSPPLKKYAALLFLKDGENFSAHIVDSQIEIDNFENVFYGFGGFWTILKNKEIQPFKNYRNSRTAIGYADQGKTLYILVVSAENKKKSLGASFEETAQIMLQLGATNAIMMDGGGSSTLVVNKKLINQDTSERVVGNNLGFIKKL
ncbi:MAG: phosphodiester glycosidase family protein [Treponemataceae bacterium]